MLYPVMFDETLAVHDNATLCTGAAAPVPASESWAGDLAALLTNDAVPDAAPVACGVNVTVRGRLLPAATVSGNEIPLSVNSELLRFTEEMVTLAPVALRLA